MVGERKKLRPRTEMRPVSWRLLAWPGKTLPDGRVSVTSRRLGSVKLEPAVKPLQ